MAETESHALRAETMLGATVTQACGSVRLPGREQASALVQADDAVVVGTQAGQLLLYKLLPSADGDPASPTRECWLEARLPLRPGVQVWRGCPHPSLSDTLPGSSDHPRISPR